MSGHAPRTARQQPPAPARFARPASGIAHFTGAPELLSRSSRGRDRAHFEDMVAIAARAAVCAAPSHEPDPTEIANVTLGVLTIAVVTQTQGAANNRGIFLPGIVVAPWLAVREHLA